jgi:hypothetical protein
MRLHLFHEIDTLYPDAEFVGLVIPRFDRYHLTRSKRLGRDAGDA